MNEISQHTHIRTFANFLADVLRNSVCVFEVDGIFIIHCILHFFCYTWPDTVRVFVHLDTFRASESCKFFHSELIQLIQLDAYIPQHF
jgi:hypothetical protein